MGAIEKEEEALRAHDPRQQPSHLAIINLVIGTLYCSKARPPPSPVHPPFVVVVVVVVVIVVCVAPQGFPRPSRTLRRSPLRPSMGRHAPSSVVLCAQAQWILTATICGAFGP